MSIQIKWLIKSSKQFRLWALQYLHKTWHCLIIRSTTMVFLRHSIKVITWRYLNCCSKRTHDTIFCTYCTFVDNRHVKKRCFKNRTCIAGLVGTLVYYLLPFCLTLPAWGQYFQIIYYFRIHILQNLCLQLNFCLHQNFGVILNFRLLGFQKKPLFG